MQEIMQLRAERFQRANAAGFAREVKLPQVQRLQTRERRERPGERDCALVADLVGAARMNRTSEAKQRERERDEERVRGVREAN